MNRGDHAVSFASEGIAAAGERFAAYPFDPALVEETTARHGSFLVLRHDRYVGRSLRIYGEWSEPELELLQGLTRPGSTVVEVGANVGAHTVPLARRVGERGRLLAFEPQRLVARLLAANLARNGCAHVEARPVAVGESAGGARIPAPDYRRPANFGGVAVGAGDDLVPLVRLDDELGREARRVELLKIDVEGMELEVLAGAERLIARDRPWIYLENDRPARSPALIRRLIALGYRARWHLPPLFSPDNFRGVRENVFPRMVSCNMLAVPEERAAGFGSAVTDPEEHPLAAAPDG
ncbi:MAG TPA: FkbM family methyltransferase [Thermoanaerobaculia bacterium]|nr:FkbM family methyltransferase [Thermoanaerobaculia bacterium]